MKTTTSPAVVPTSHRQRYVSSKTKVIVLTESTRPSDCGSLCRTSFGNLCESLGNVANIGFGLNMEFI